MFEDRKSYSILKRQFFAEGRYSIVPIRYEDRIVIMQWRNEQLYHLRQSKPLTIEDQNNYFDTVVAKGFYEMNPKQLLFSYLEEDSCIGYGGLVHINWIDKNAEISFVMKTKLEIKEFEFQWTTYLRLIEQVAFDELKLHKIFTYAYDVRPRLYPVLEAQGYKKEAVLKEHLIFDGEYKDIVIHSKLSS